MHNNKAELINLGVLGRVAVAALVLLALASCGGDGGETEGSPTAPPGMFSTLPTEEPPVLGDQPPTIELNTPEPTLTPNPTPTPNPTYTPAPTLTPLPSATPLPTLAPTGTPVPTEVPTLRANGPEPTATTVPTATPDPTAGTIAGTYRSSHTFCPQLLPLLRQHKHPRPCQRPRTD